MTQELRDYIVSVNRAHDRASAYYATLDMHLMGCGGEQGRGVFAIFPNNPIGHFVGYVDVLKDFGVGV